MADADRLRLIAEIEQHRKSRLITYVLSDRPRAQAQIAEDAVRPIYDHLRGIGRTARIDLFLHSVGGFTDIPWRIVTMIREFAPTFAVLVPYKAMSAATMIALGADEIVMGRKGELGPIDPKLSIKRGRDGGTAVQEEIAAEDIMSYLRFLQEKAGLTDQSALAGPISALAQKLDPWILGQINRAHSHIRSVARKLLLAHSKKHVPDEQQIQVVVETLAEKTYQHGHAIGRKEAKEIGLDIVDARDRLDDLLWELYEDYERLCRIRDPIEPRTFVPVGQDEHVEQIVMGATESAGLAYHFTTDLRMRNKRQPQPQLSVNVNVNLQLPSSLQGQQLPAAIQQAIQQAMQGLQQQAVVAVQEAMRAQMPIVDVEGWTESGAWRRIEPWPRP